MATATDRTPLSSRDADDHGSYDQLKDLIGVLQSTPAVPAALPRGVGQGQDQARAARGGDEGWSVVGVLCHLRDAEERVLERLLAMRDQDDAFLAEHHQDAWARERSYETADLREELGAFTRYRSTYLVTLASLDEPVWHRTGRHEEQGSVTISGHTLHIVSHDAVHCAQIARQLGT